MYSKIKSLKNHQGFMKYFKNISWLMLERVFRMIVGLFVGIWIARYLGPEQFGVFSYVQSFVGLFTVLATFGLDSIIIRELVKDENKRDELLGTAFFLKLCGAFLVMIILFIVINFTTNDSNTNTLVFIIASATFFQSFNVIDFYFQSKALNKFVVYANILGIIISSTVKIILILNEAPLIMFAYNILFDSFILAVGFIYFYTKQKIVIRTWKFNKELSKELLNDSWPLIFTTLIISIYSKLDQVMLMNMINAVEVGQYAAAVKLNGIWSFIPGVILVSITPAIINAKKVSKRLYLQRLQVLYDYTVLYGYITITIVIIFATLIISVTYGSEYKDSAYLLQILVISNIFAYIGAASSRWYINEGFTKKILYRNLLGVFLNIAGNLYFIPIYGAVGAAIVTIVSQFSANYLYDYLDKDSKIVFYQKTKAFFLVSSFHKILLKAK